MSAEITLEFLECTGEYQPDDEGPEDHDPDCIVRDAMFGGGRWDDPEVISDRN